MKKRDGLSKISENGRSCFTVSLANYVSTRYRLLELQYIYNSNFRSGE